MFQIQKTNRSIYSFTGLIFGVLAVIPFFGIFSGILAIVFGSLGLLDIKKNKKIGKFEAYSAIALGIIFILIWSFLKNYLDHTIIS